MLRGRPDAVPFQIMAGREGGSLRKKTGSSDSLGMTGLFLGLGRRLCPMSPVSGTTAGVSDGKHHDFGREILIRDAEGKLAENVFSEILEVDGPAVGSFFDSCYCLLEGPFKT